MLMGFSSTFSACLAGGLLTFVGTGEVDEVESVEDFFKKLLRRFVVNTMKLSILLVCVFLSVVYGDPIRTNAASRAPAAKDVSSKQYCGIKPVSTADFGQLCKDVTAAKGSFSKVVKAIIGLAKSAKLGCPGQVPGSQPIDFQYHGISGQQMVVLLQTVNLGGSTYRFLRGSVAYMTPINYNDVIDIIREIKEERYHVQMLDALVSHCMDCKEHTGLITNWFTTKYEKAAASTIAKRYDYSCRVADHYRNGGRRAPEAEYGYGSDEATD
eukprot:gene240-1767_t